MESAVLKKFGFKDVSTFSIVNAPITFDAERREMRKLATELEVGNSSKIDFIIAFVKDENDVTQTAPTLVEALRPDGKLWFAYLKKSSKKFNGGITRDSGWQILGNLGFEGVKQISIDEDWSALRFRDVLRIKSLKRNSARAMSEEGKKRTGLTHD